jgi:predicted membrane protein
MKRTITALAIILLGVIVFLANTNLFGMQSLLATWWPLGLIAVAGLVLMNNPKQYVWPLFLVAAGVAIQLNNLKVTTINIGDVIFPAIVITFGVSMLVNGRPNRNVSADSSEEVSAFLSGTSTKNSAKDYTGARMTAVMGGIEMDLSHAEIKNEAVLNVFVVMGGIELRVPENVIVKNRASVVLGGIEDKTRPTDSKHNPVLFIDGSILMGGVEVKR